MKYYKVIKENPLWEVGAIIKLDPNSGRNGGYFPIEDIWDKTKDQEEYLSLNIIENNPEFFQRVYKSGTDKILYLTKEQFKKVFKKFTE